MVNKKCIFVLGAARSGKSRFAQELASQLGERVLFVATAAPGDEEMRQRIEAHRGSRPSSWTTMEIHEDVGEILRRKSGYAQVVLVDCLSLLIANLLPQSEEDYDPTTIEARARAEVARLVAAMDELPASFIVVSNEVGMGLVPPYPLGRLYRDVLGRANQSLAQRADDVYLMVAGIPLRVKP